MADDSLSRNQERFLQGLLLGKSIVDAAKFAGISEATAHRWLKDPAIQVERASREKALAEAEQAEVKRILTSGYALMHKRVQALDELITLLRQEALDAQKRWLADVKAVGFERVDLLTFNDGLLREYRAAMDDIAKEVGHRVKRQQELGDGNLVELLNAEHASLLGDLEALPDASSDKKQTDASDTGSYSVPPGA